METIRGNHKKISLRRQCELLSVPRSSLYYEPIQEKPENIKMMDLMDKHLINHPTEGVVSMRGLEITHANQAWCTDITYIPMARGFMYMTAYIDVYSRKIMGWGISNSMSKKWCLDVLEAAIEKHGKPEIINSDQGSQYTSHAWTHYLEENEIKISMDGKGRATDNAWIERFWKTMKYEYIYLNPCDTGLELFGGVQAHIEYYHNKTHHTLKTSPNEAFEKSIKKYAA